MRNPPHVVYCWSLIVVAIVVVNCLVPGRCWAVGLCPAVAFGMDYAMNHRRTHRPTSLCVKCLITCSGCIPHLRCGWCRHPRRLWLRQLGLLARLSPTRCGFASQRTLHRRVPPSHHSGRLQVAASCVAIVVLPGCFFFKKRFSETGNADKSDSFVGGFSKGTKSTV